MDLNHIIKQRLHKALISSGGVILQSKHKIINIENSNEFRNFVDISGWFEDSKTFRFMCEVYVENKVIRSYILFKPKHRLTFFSANTTVSSKISIFEYIKYLHQIKKEISAKITEALVCRYILKYL